MTHRAHELLAVLRAESDDYGRIIKAVKFDLGTTETFNQSAKLAVKPDCRPPYPVCLFQITGPLDCYIYLVYSEKFEGRVVTHVTLFFRDERLKAGWMQAKLHLRLVHSSSSEESKGLFYWDDGREATKEELLDDAAIHSFARALVDVVRVIEVFSCCNVVKVEHQAPRLINQKRAKKNLPPIFSFHTLHISGERIERADEKLGTHASPRLHLRRGHIRHLSDGRRIWVRSAVVGSRTNGFVAKDYQVRGGKQ